MNSVDVKITVGNLNKKTIWDCLAEKLGRQPTPQEAVDEVKRILGNK